MIEQITGVTKANEVRMKRSLHKGAFLLVEGQYDFDVYTKHLADSSQLKIIVSAGKRNVKDAMRILSTSNFQGVFGIVDDDFDVMLGSSSQGFNVFATDTHDIETMILSAGLFRNYCDSYINAWALKELEKRIGWAHSTSKCTTLLNDFKRSIEAEALSRPLVKQNLQALYLS